MFDSVPLHRTPTLIGLTLEVDQRMGAGHVFSFCKDVKFAEQLKRAGIRNTIVVIFDDDPLFYEGNSDGIYGFFRG